MSILDVAKGVAAQLSPFDNGATYSAYNGPSPSHGGGGGGGGWGDGPSGVLGAQTTQTSGVANGPNYPVQTSGGGGYTTSAAPDPYAKWGGQANYNNLLSGFNTQKQNIYNSSMGAASDQSGQIHQGILDTIHNLTMGQQNIDRQNVQNLASKLQGTQDIYNSVGQGIKSGGVMLANKNAGNSSAAAALAAAYGDQGRRQLSKIGNQFEANKGNIAIAQGEQDYQLQRAPEKFHQTISDTVNNIVSSAGDKFAQLDAAMANASLPDRLAIEQEKQNVRNQVIGILQQYDNEIRSGTQGIHAASDAQNIAAARNQQLAGTAPENAFQYDTNAPGQFQNGPFASTLPIFTFPGAKKQQG